MSKEQDGRRVGPRSGFVKATFSLKPEHLAALLAEARARAGLARADASAVVRELIEAWISGVKRTKHTKREG